MSVSKTWPEVIVITGGSAGVGRAIAREFARHGDYVAVLARGEDRLEDTRLEIERLGGKALIIPTDVADSKQVEEAAERVERELGPIDIWVNNAMTAVFAPVSETSAEEFERVTDVTYHGSVYGTMAALKRMYPRNRGKIVQVSSALGYRGIPLQAAYCGAKHAILGFLDSVRSEIIHDTKRITISAVHLPAVNTPQFEWVKSKLPNCAQPVPPIYQPEVIADAVYFAAHSRRRDITVGFSAAKAIFGQRIVPGGWIDKFLSKQGYSGQQTDELDDKNRPFNLWDPVPGHQAAHGSFDNRARNESPQFWLNKNRGTVGLVAFGAGVLLLTSWMTRRSRELQ